MHKTIVLALFILFPTLLLAQQKSLIVLQNSRFAKTDTKTNITYINFPTFLHSGATLKCDSAVLYKERNFFEAYKNVHIIQGDTINIYADFLTYDGNTKLAHLTGNVKMITPSSTLTTPVLDYNTGTKLGQYFDGGRIINPDADIVSKRGWYFANTRDAYFRYNVLVKTPQTTITSDTLRYNTGSNWSYFYGPTDIKGKDDNMYTENGAYNTRTENAYFGLKNLYTNGSRSLKGDSLYYNGKKGYGRAVKNIVYNDTTDKTVLYGQLGEYYKAEEKIVVTRNAYIGMDTKDSVTINNVKTPDTLWLSADTLQARKVLVKGIKLIEKPTVVSDNQIGKEEKEKAEEKEKEKAAAKKQLAAEEKKEQQLAPENDKKQFKRQKKKAETDDKKVPENSVVKPPDSTLLKRQAFLKDSLTKDSLLKITSKINLSKDSVLAKGKAIGKKLTAKDSLALKLKPSLSKLKDTAKVFNPADTVRAREIKAYHNVRVYKGNMQAVADSLYFNAADSALRWFKNPILWGENSQQTGDTIYVFFQNKKPHSFLVLQNGFIVSVEADSAKFNQVKGKKITGFFVKGELNTMFVDGNAESIYYTKKDNGEYDTMNQSVSSRIKFKFAEKELTDISMYNEVEGTANPIDDLPKESLLTGFIWKPELRPISKKDVITYQSKLKSSAKKPAVKPNPKAKPGAVKINPKSVSTQKVLQSPTVKKAADTLKQALPQLKKAVDSVKIDSLPKKSTEP